VAVYVRSLEPFNAIICGQLLLKGNNGTPLGARKVPFLLVHCV
jgi:hypothetical protein